MVDRYEISEPKYFVAQEDYQVQILAVPAHRILSPVSATFTSNDRCHIPINHDASRESDPTILCRPGPFSLSRSETSIISRPESQVQTPLACLVGGTTSRCDGLRQEEPGLVVDENEDFILSSR